MFNARRIVIIIAAAAAMQISAAAGIYEITITNEGFSPQVLRVPAGSTVTWTNLEGVHTTTELRGHWDSGVLTEGQSFIHPFDETGFFYYKDTIHQWPSGLVEVVHSLAEIDITADKKLYASGDTIEVGLSLQNPGEAVPVGLYVWIVGPGGHMTWLLQLPSALLPAGFSFQESALFSQALGALKRGEYFLYAALVKKPGLDLISGAEAGFHFGEALQTDWSGGPRFPGPAALWENRFSAANGIGWRSLPGRIALSATPRPAPIEQVIVEDASRPNGVAVADLNGDGLDDVITTDPVYDLYHDLGAVYWWTQPTDRGWIQNTVSDDFYGATYAGATDMDGDGDLDVYAAAYYGDGPELGRNGKFAWFENLEGDASSWEKHLVGDLFWGAGYVDAGDIDGDGDMDLVGAYSHPTGPSQFAWWENEAGDGSAWTKRFIPFTFWGSGYFGVGDLDKDGDLDLMGGGYNTSTVGWWQNLDGTGTSWQAWSVGALPSGRGADLQDVDGDGDLDGILWSSYWVYWVENDGEGFGWTPRTLTMQTNLPWVAAGDVNNDGKLDLAVCSDEAGLFPGVQLRWYDLSLFTGGPGELSSTILDGAPGAGWGRMTWDANVPAGALLEMEVRASDDAGDLGPYLPVPASGYDLADLIDPAARYLQYRVRFFSPDPLLSPVLREVRLEKGEGH